MKTIGFIDLYLSEWHANNYPEWIRQACEKSGDDFVVKYAWAEEDVSPVDGVTTDEWCEKYGVEKCNSIAEVCEKADYILVLAPSNPETHLRYAKEVLKYKKNTYIDKTFAPDYATAKEIFDIAKKTARSSSRRPRSVTQPSLTVGTILKRSLSWAEVRTSTSILSTNSKCSLNFIKTRPQNACAWKVKAINSSAEWNLSTAEWQRLSSRLRSAIPFALTRAVSTPSSYT